MNGRRWWPAGLVMAGFAGPAPDDAILDLIAQGLGGVVLFARNVESADQLRSMTVALQGHAAKHGHPPLLIAVDHEGGRVQRIRLPGVTIQPSAMAFGAAGDPALTRKMAGLAALQLLSLGINVNLAPCADVNRNPRSAVVGTRAFGADPGDVARHVAAYVGGAQAAGLMTTAKHFPGHGATAVDSHLALPVVARSPEDLAAIDLVPFGAAIGAGVAAVMPGHLVVPARTGDVPSTLSPAMLSGLLRTEMGYDGLIISDCMEMQAIADQYSPAEATQMAVAAGVDLVLWSHSLDRQLSAIRALGSAAVDGRIDGRRLDNAHQRVMALRGRLARQPAASVATEGGGAALAAAVHAKATRLLRDRCGLLPLATGQPVTVIPIGNERQAATAIGWAETLVTALASSGCLPSTVPPVLTSDPACVVQGATTAIAATAAGGGAVVLTVRDALFDPALEELVAKLAAIAPERCIVVALGLPDDAWRCSQAGCALATFDDARGALLALAEVLTGKATASQAQ
jgi:beta-N-acetylhexosaminidase